MTPNAPRGPNAFGPLHDTGERIVFETGMRRDTAVGKPRFDLTIPEGLPYEDTMQYRLAVHMAKGADKYEDRNWECARTPAERARFKESAYRHFMEWYCEVEDGEDKAASLFFNVIGKEWVDYKTRNGTITDD